MKSVLKSFIIAFSMFSKIPMPIIEWKSEYMRYVICFFPLVGGIIGGTIYLISYVTELLQFSHVFSTIILIIIPLMITGGIHMDGFLDTTDALSSYQPKEKKLEILKDPHTGAFAVIFCVAYYFLTFGVWYEARLSTLSILALSFILSRALSGLSIVTFPLAKSNGSVAMFSNESNREISCIIMILYIIVCSAFMCLINFKLGFSCIINAFCVFVYYKSMSMKKFGGITGDLAGYFLQLCELIMAFTVIIADKLR